MKSKSDPRHNARRLALASVFCWLFSDPDNRLCLELSQEVLECQNVDTALVDRIVAGVQENTSEIDRLVQKCAPEWPINKISKVDLVILRIAIWEIMHEQEAPEKVVIDEAVELAKEFGNDTSPKFVNGVLGSVIDQLKGDNPDQKENG